MNSKNKSAYIQALEAELAKLGKVFVKEKTFYRFNNGDLAFARPDATFVAINKDGLVNIFNSGIAERVKLHYLPFPEVVKFFEQLLPKLGIREGSLGKWCDSKEPRIIPGNVKGNRITFDGSFLYLNAYPVFNFHTGNFVKVVEAEVVEISQALQESPKPSVIEVGDIVGTKDRRNGSIGYTQVNENLLPIFKKSLESGELDYMFEVKVFKKSEDSISEHAFEILTKVAGWEK